MKNEKLHSRMLLQENLISQETKQRKKAFKDQLKETDFKDAFAIGFQNFWRELKYSLGGEYTPKMSYREYKELKDAKKTQN